jgi:hypothetical protein
MSIATMKKSAIRVPSAWREDLDIIYCTLAVAGVCRVSFYLLSSLFSFFLSPMRVFHSLPGLSYRAKHNGECHNKRRHRRLIKQFKAHRI